MLGHERFREQEERSTFDYVLDIVRAVLAAGEWQVDDEMEHTFARIFFGAMSSAGASVSTAEDADTEAERVELAIGFILSGLRALSEQGTQLRDARYFWKMTLPPSTGTSSIHVCPAGTVSLLTLLRGQRDRRLGHLPLVPEAGDHPAVVEQQRVPLAGQQRLGHVVARGVEVARVTLTHAQHQHVGGRELVAGRRVAVEVVVAAVGELPLRGVAAGELGVDRGALMPLGMSLSAPHWR